MIDFEEYSNSEIISVIDEWIKNAKHRDILKRRLIDGLGYEYIAEEYEYSRTQIVTIIRKGEETIIKHLKTK